MSKTTFYQIFECISLKCWIQEACKYSQIHANSHASCAQNFFNKCLSIFFGKMSLPQTVFFSISNFWYKLTQPSGHRFFANIFAITKTFAKSFLPVHMGPRWNLLSKKKWSKISWQCSFKVHNEGPWFTVYRNKASLAYF